MKTKKQAEKLAETIIGKLSHLQGVTGGSITLQEATRLVRKYIDNEIKRS